MSAGRILVIDDEPHIRETMRMALESAGHTVGTADDGPGGLEAFGDGSKWDLVLLDQRMPGMDGLAVLGRLRERDPSAEVIMVTAYATVELAVDAMKAGALDFLRKPFTPEVLRQTVAAGLDRAADVRRRAAEQSAPAGPGPAAAAPRRRDTPLVTFRSLNGYECWPAADLGPAEVPPAGQVWRTFTIQAPNKTRGRCTVKVEPEVQTWARKQAGRAIRPDDAMWDAVCMSILMSHFWTDPGMPPSTLVVQTLTPSQRAVIQQLAGTTPFRR